MFLECEKEHLFFEVKRKPRKQYSKEQILDFYDNYLHNLSIIPFEKKWLKLDEINDRRPESLMIQKWANPDNPYLRGTIDNKLVLGRDVLERGMYWAAVVFEDPTGEYTASYHNGKYTSADGHHRLGSLKMLDKIGEYPGNREFYSVILPWEIYRFHYLKKREAYNVPKEPLPMMYLPADLRVYHDTHVRKEKTQLRTTNFRYINEDMIEVKDMVYLDEAWMTYMAMPRWLSFVIYEYEERTGDKIETGPMIRII